MFKYDILCDESVDGLIKQVNSYLKKGWQCQGGIGILTEGKCYKVFYQAMIKENKNG